jgi:hypothetical protein
MEDREVESRSGAMKRPKNRQKERGMRKMVLSAVWTGIRMVQNENNEGAVL